jgi:hypothetical protein
VQQLLQLLQLLLQTLSTSFLLAEGLAGVPEAPLCFAAAAWIVSLA